MPGTRSPTSPRTSRGPIAVRNVAPVVKRVTVWCVGLSLLSVAAAIGFIVARERLGLPRGGWYGFIAPALGFLPVVVILPLTNWRLRHLRRAWKDSGGRLCAGCGYDVSTLASPAGACPECGRRYDHPADAPLWRNAGFR
ncbi:MAG TPA: hypothetical protein VFF65_04080 [Phycisphaerales bacterium]|nr:hypothetical protein [Phycisphaerales bacterium]